MKNVFKLTLAFLVPLATACIAQSGPPPEDVDSNGQSVSSEVEGQPQQQSAHPVAPSTLANEFTTSTVPHDQPIREMNGDPTTPKKVDGADPVPVPWAPEDVKH